MNEKIRNYIDAMSAREKQVLILFGFFAASFLIVGLYLLMETRIEGHAAELREKQELMAKMEGQKLLFLRAREKERATLLAIQTNETNLNSYLNMTRELFGVEISTIKELKPEKKGELQIERLEVNIRMIDMQTLMAFLYKLEDRARFVYIDALSIKKRFDGTNYEVGLVVAVLREVREK